MKQAKRAQWQNTPLARIANCVASAVLVLNLFPAQGLAEMRSELDGFFGQDYAIEQVAQDTGVLDATTDLDARGTQSASGAQGTQGVQDEQGAHAVQGAAADNDTTGAALEQDDNYLQARPEQGHA